MTEDSAVRRLAKKLFPYLWLRHKLLTCLPGRGPNSPKITFTRPDNIGKAVLVYSHSLRPLLMQYMTKHLPSSDRSKIKFWYHVSFLCLQVRLMEDNIYDFFLTTCSIMSEVALFYYRTGFDDVLPHASSFMVAFFENELSKGFYEAGGWEGLNLYMTENLCLQEYARVSRAMERLKTTKDCLPLSIAMKNEHLTAQRRERLLSIKICKTGEAEREMNAKILVAEILRWDFEEQMRISSIPPTVFQCIPNVRHVKGKHFENSTSGIKSGGFGYFSISNNELRLTSSSPEIFSSSKSDIKVTDTLHSSPLRESHYSHERNDEQGKLVTCSKSALVRERGFFRDIHSHSTLNGNKNCKNFPPKKITKEIVQLKRLNANTMAVKSKCNDNQQNQDFQSSKHNLLQNTVPDPENNLELDENSTSGVNESVEKESTSMDHRLNDLEISKGESVFLFEPKDQDEDSNFIEFTKSLDELGFQCVDLSSYNPGDENPERFLRNSIILKVCEKYLSRDSFTKRCLIIFPSDIISEENGNYFNSNSLKNKTEFTVDEGIENSVPSDSEMDNSVTFKQINETLKYTKQNPRSYYIYELKAHPTKSETVVEICSSLYESAENEISESLSRYSTLSNIVIDKNGRVKRNSSTQSKSVHIRKIFEMIKFQIAGHVAISSTKWTILCMNQMENNSYTFQHNAVESGNEINDDNKIAAFVTSLEGLDIKQPIIFKV